MRLRTVKSRFKLSGLPYRYVHEAYERMKGKSDESTLIGRENNDLWIETVRLVIEKYERALREEVNDFHRHCG